MCLPGHAGRAAASGEADGAAAHHHPHPELPGLDVEYSQPTFKWVDGSFVGPVITPPTFEVEHTPAVHRPLEVELPEVEHRPHGAHRWRRARYEMAVEGTSCAGIYQSAT